LSVMIVGPRRRVVFLGRLSVYRFRILLSPRLDPRVSRLFLLDVIAHRPLCEAERGDRHRVETLADTGITGSKFARFLERDLLPKTREMQNAKWVRNAGTDQWNICVSHRSRYCNPTISELQVPTESEASPVGGALSHTH